MSMNELIDEVEETLTPSPFLPDSFIQYAWDSTCLGWAKTCPRLYYYNMICGFRPKRESIHLRFGQEYHSALEEYDTLRALANDHEEAVHETMKSLMNRLEDYPEPDPNDKPSVRYKTKHALARTVLWYLDKHEHDPAKTYIKSDGMPAVELSFRFELEYSPYTYDTDGNAEGDADQPYMLCGHLDRIVNFNGDKFVMDRKTTTSTPGTYYFQRYEPDNQMTLYTLAGQLISKTPVLGVIIDVAQVMADSTRYVRGITYRSQDQLDEWRFDLSYLLRSYEHYAIEKYWPQNDTACDKFGGCRFRDVCSNSPGIRDNILKHEFTQERLWNPLETR